MQTLGYNSHQSTLAGHVALATVLALSLPVTLSAQSLFGPRIYVNDAIITGFDLEQKQNLLDAFQTQGSPAVDAREALIDDRLKQIEINSARIDLTENDIDLGIEDMAARATMNVDEFVAVMKDNGVEERTLRDFVAVSIGWADLVRTRFLSRARPSDEEIDRVLSQAERGTVEVRLAEVIMPVDEENADKVDVVARRIAEMTDEAEFSEAARRYSVAPTSVDGGATGWLPLAGLPASLRPPLLALSHGGVSEPISLRNSIGLFQLRGIREISVGTEIYSEIQYAILGIPKNALPDISPETLSFGYNCDDLYGLALDRPGVRVQREALAPELIPTAISSTLERLDSGEAAYLPVTALPVVDPESDDPADSIPAERGMVMVCGRTATVNENTTREEVAQVLASRQLETLANQLLERLHADAFITGQ